MKAAMVMALFVAVGFSAAAGAGSDSGETKKQEETKGITVDDLGRGLKSAAQNIEKEIPKIGPAIGETVKKLTGKDKPSDQKPSKQDNRPVASSRLMFVTRLSPRSLNHSR